MPSTPTHFSCPHCGKQYAWKPSLAGKRAKCACGQAITVPQAEEPESSDDDLYDFAEPAPPVKPAAVAPRPAQAATASVAAGASVLNYTTRQTEEKGKARFDDFYHAPRDFYWPSAILVAGFIGLLAWALTAGASAGGLLVFTGFIVVATLIKTVVMIGAAFVIAPLAGVSFGTLWTAVLKLAAVVVMTDAALFWLQEVMEMTGAYPSGGGGRRMWITIGLINTVLAGAIIAILLKILFDMDREEVGMIAIPLAILNRVLNFIILVVVVAIVMALANAASSPPAGGSAAAAGSAPALAQPPPASSVGSRSKDAEIAEQIKKGDLRDARKHLEQTKAEQSQIYFVRNLRRMGAPNVYVQLGGDARTDATHLIVELPDSDQKREAVFDALRGFVLSQRIRMDISTIIDEGSRYATIPMPPKLE